MTITRRTVRGTRASVAVAAGSLGLLLLSSTTQDGWLVLLAGLGLGIVVAAFVTAPRIDKLDVTVTLPPRARAGDPVDATVSVTQRGRGTSVPVTLTVGADDGTVHRLAAGRMRVGPLGAGATAQAALPLTVLRRGPITHAVVTLHTTAPFSLVAVTHRRVVEVECLVHPPRTQGVHPAATGRGENGAASTAPRGLEVHGVREWRHGEPISRLHARGTARHGRPLVLDRHDDSGDGLAVLVAGRGEDDPLHESMLAVVAATLVERAEEGRPATVTVAGRDGVLTTAEPSTLLDLIAWIDRLDHATPADVARAASAAGDGGVVVLASLDASEDLLAVTELAAAARAHGAVLHVLHRATDRSDALCLHATDQVIAAVRR